MFGSLGRLSVEFLRFQHDQFTMALAPVWRPTAVLPRLARSANGGFAFLGENMLTVIANDGQPIRARDERKPEHFWADKEIVEDYLPDLGVYAFSIYMLLCYYARSSTGRAWPSITTLAIKLKISKPTVRSALDDLANAGLILISPNSKTSKNGKEIPQSYTYTITAVKKHRDETGVVNDVYQGSKPDLPGVVNLDTTNKNKINKKESTREDSNTLSQPASQVTTPAPSLPPSRDDNRPKVVENAQADGEIVTLQESSSTPTPVPVPPSPPLLPDGWLWLCSSVHGTLAHAVPKGKEKQGRTACGASLEHRTDCNAPIGNRAYCLDCQHKAIAVPPKKPAPEEGVLDALCILCYGTVDAFSLNASAIRGAYNKIEKCCAPITLEEMRGFYLWWTQTDWRGKRGDKPNPYLVASLWATFKSERNGVTNGHASQSNAENAAERQRRNTAELEHAVAWDDDGPTNSASAPRGLPPNNRSVA